MKITCVTDYTKQNVLQNIYVSDNKIENITTYLAVLNNILQNVCVLDKQTEDITTYWPYEIIFLEYLWPKVKKN
jgi:Leucine-rich repeat (LRR) protein